MYRRYAMRASAAHYWQARAYNAAGQLTRFTLGNGVETRRSYSRTGDWARCFSEGEPGNE